MATITSAIVMIRHARTARIGLIMLVPSPSRLVRFGFSQESPRCFRLSLPAFLLALRNIRAHLARQERAQLAPKSSFWDRWLSSKTAVYLSRLLSDFSGLTSWLFLAWQLFDRPGWSDLLQFGHTRRSPAFQKILLIDWCKALLLHRFLLLCCRLQDCILQTGKCFILQSRGLQVAGCECFILQVPGTAFSGLLQSAGLYFADG